MKEALVQSALELTKWTLLLVRNNGSIVIKPDKDNIAGQGGSAGPALSAEAIETSSKFTC